MSLLDEVGIFKEAARHLWLVVFIVAIVLIVIVKAPRLLNLVIVCILDLDLLFNVLLYDITALRPILSIDAL